MSILIIDHNPLDKNAIFDMGVNFFKEDLWELCMDKPFLQDGLLSIPKFREEWNKKTNGEHFLSIGMTSDSAFVMAIGMLRGSILVTCELWMLGDLLKDCSIKRHDEEIDNAHWSHRSNI